MNLLKKRKRSRAEKAGIFWGLQKTWKRKRVGKEEEDEGGRRRKASTGGMGGMGVGTVEWSENWKSGK